MKVRFKNGKVLFDVEEDNGEFEWDEVLQKYCEVVRLKGLGSVPKELLEEAETGIPIVDVLIELNGDKKHQESI